MGRKRTAGAVRKTKVASAKGTEARVKLTHEQIESWMPPIARGLIPLDDAAEKLEISVKQVSAYLGNWKRRQARNSAPTPVSGGLRAKNRALYNATVAKDEKKEKARKAKNARQRERRAEVHKREKVASAEVGEVQEAVAQEPTMAEVDNQS